jgi:hypothetical protein
MIRCIPKGICSWDFSLVSEGHHASVSFHWLGEQGAIVADDVRLEVCKHGVVSGKWTLEQDGEPLIVAQKPAAYIRTFEVSDSHGTAVLRAESPFGRSFRIERANELIATIVPDHAFTRRATIETLAENCDFTALSFSFWLVVLTWRRAAQSAAS